MSLRHWGAQHCRRLPAREPGTFPLMTLEPKSSLAGHGWQYSETRRVDHRQGGLLVECVCTCMLLAHGLPREVLQCIIKATLLFPPFHKQTKLSFTYGCRVIKNGKRENNLAITWPRRIFIIIKNEFYSIVLKAIDNSPDLGAILEAFLLNLFVYINMDSPSLSLFKALHLQSHGQYLSNNSCSLGIARSATL